MDNTSISFFGVDINYLYIYRTLINKLKKDKPNAIIDSSFCSPYITDDNYVFIQNHENNLFVQFDGEEFLEYQPLHLDDHIKKELDLELFKKDIAFIHITSVPKEIIQQYSVNILKNPDSMFYVWGIYQLKEEQLNIIFNNFNFTLENIPKNFVVVNQLPNSFEELNYLKKGKIPKKLILEQYLDSSKNQQQEKIHPYIQQVLSLQLI